MKNILFFIIFIASTASTASAYDITFKDKYGRTTGYADVDSNGKAVVIDKYGRRGNTIDKHGVVRDKYGRIKGKIQK